MITTATAPVATILPGGCLPPHITPTLPVEPKPWERNCWDPTKWGTDIQLPSPDSEIQALAGAAQLG